MRLIFGLAQGGIVPSYAVILREFLPTKNIASKIGLVLMATIFGMAFGGWISGYIFDLTGAYDLAFFNGIIWNICNILLIVYLKKLSALYSTIHFTWVQNPLRVKTIF